MQWPEVRRIYVRAPNWVGDLVMATSAFRRVRESFPVAQITCAVRPFLRSLLHGSQWFDDYLDADKARGLGGLLHQAAELRKRAFDLAVVLPNSLETALVPFLAGVPRRLGYRQGRPFLMNLGLTARGNRAFGVRYGPRRVPTPMPNYYEDLLDVIGLPRVDLRPVLRVTDAERAALGSWLLAHGVRGEDRLALLNAGANYGGSKLWEVERWVEVARRLASEHGLKPILLAGPSDQELVAKIAALSGAVAAIDPILAVDSLKPFCERAALMITTDSGPRHVAVAFRMPVVCLMGPNDPRYTEYCLEESIVIRKDLDCSPCQLKVCPLGHRRCMTEITVEEVLTAAREVLARAARKIVC